MKFGGHETFFLRPGWLTKGLHLVKHAGGVTWNGDNASDTMGVGRNMSKSIGWWLNRIGLAGRPGRNQDIATTDFGQAVIDLDPYLMHMETWWFIHVALSCRGRDDVFRWFFQTHRDSHFTRDLLEGALMKGIDISGGRLPASKTLERDVAVLLQSYATSIPARNPDPEDNLECPLRGLNLIVLREGLQTYERRRPVNPAPAAAIAATLGLAASDTDSDGYADIPLDMTGPVRTLARTHGVTPEDFVGLAAVAADLLGPRNLSIRFLAGQRVATVRRRSFADWVRLGRDSGGSMTKAAA